MSEQALWLAVLDRALQDATVAPTGETGVYRTASIEEAREFLTTPRHNLATICSLAGLETDAFIDIASKKIAAAPSVAELANTDPRKRKAKEKPTKPKTRKVIRVAERTLTFNGETLTIKEWSDRTGIAVNQIGTRLNQHWTVERALTQPIGKRNRAWGLTGAPSLTTVPGVRSDFRRREGTGGGGSVQDRSKIDFSNQKVSA